METISSSTNLSSEVAASITNTIKNQSHVNLKRTVSKKPTTFEYQTMCPLVWNHQNLGRILHKIHSFMILFPHEIEASLLNPLLISSIKSTLSTMTKPTGEVTAPISH